jgi:predicted transport protein
MPFPEINDPKKKCKDYAGIGHWGNGDVRVYLESIEELAYIMGLVRQSFECQMGDASKA